MDELNYPTLRRVKQIPSFLDKSTRIVNWVPIKKLSSHKLKNRAYVVGNKGYLSLKMFKELILQVLFNLIDREMAGSLFDRVSFLLL